MSLEIKIIKNYASSLFTLVKKASLEQEIIEEMKVFNSFLNDLTEFRKTMLSPIISKDHKNNIIISIVDKYKFHDLTKYFLHTLIKNSRMNLLQNIIEEFEHIYKVNTGVKVATILVSSLLNTNELNDVKLLLEKSLNSKIEINQEINKSLLGGIIIKYDSQLIDFSVYGALNKIEKIITHA